MREGELIVVKWDRLKAFRIDVEAFFLPIIANLAPILATHPDF